MNTYATTFDKGYASRAIVLAESFARHCPGETLFLCCMDDDSYRIMSELNMPGTVCVPHDAFAPPELANLRGQRSVGEYCWTSKPYILEHAIRAEPHAEWAVYLDTDMMVFGSLSEPLESLQQLDGLFTPHNFSPEFADYASTVGRFNAGYAAFRNNRRGTDALSEWKRLCTDSCSATPGETGYGDQRYLDGLAARWRTEASPALVGLNAAPWNVGNYEVREVNHVVSVDGEPLRLFHFQGLRVISRRIVDLYVGPYRLPANARAAIYVPYANKLCQAERMLSQRFPSLYRSGDRRLGFRGTARTIRRTLSGVGNLFVFRPSAPALESP